MAVVKQSDWERANILISNIFLPESGNQMKKYFKKVENLESRWVLIPL